MKNLFQKVKHAFFILLLIVPVTSLIVLIVTLACGADMASTLSYTLFALAVFPGGIAFMIYGRHPYSSVIYEENKYNNYYR